MQALTGTRFSVSTVRSLKMIVMRKSTELEVKTVAIISTNGRQNPKTGSFMHA